MPGLAGKPLNFAARVQVPLAQRPEPRQVLEWLKDAEELKVPLDSLDWNSGCCPIAARHSACSWEQSAFAVLNGR